MQPWLSLGVAAGVAGLATRLFWPASQRRKPVDAAKLEGQFRKAIDKMKAAARARGAEFVDINAGALHRQVGGYPGPGHHLPLCCATMRETLGPDDFTVKAPRNGSGAALTLRYHLA